MSMTDFIHATVVETGAPVWIPRTHLAVFPGAFAAAGSADGETPTSDESTSGDDDAETTLPASADELDTAARAAKRKE